ncbi:hypothetical protein F4820DRAFT_459601 [Hypoxylon rubiginosum]|uniref:Uncharacterized protein n=1 Tax=Hypoxylon rubiginosum TaxID=110542 RepID=A0ACB9YVX4_9PEZI|nr:hypothetical protein F4820DRAFT_459601 [Hypoxylon rubiginosum]
MRPEDLDQYYGRIPATYGVELQFLIPVLVEGQPDPHPDDGRQVLTVQPGTAEYEISRQVIDNVLIVLRGVARVPAWKHLGGILPHARVIAAMEEESQSIARRAQYSQWVVESAPDLLLRRDPFEHHYTWIGVKIRSSKRDSTLPGHFDPIANAIVALRQYFRLRLAPSTSLMVHIGEKERDSDSYEMCPVWLRVFCTLWWFVETHVFLLSHHSRRINGKCLPLTRHSRLNTMNDEELAEEIEDGLQGADFAYLHERMHHIVPTCILSRRERDEAEFIWRAKDTNALVHQLLVHKLELVAMDDTGRLEADATLGRGSLGFQGFCEGAQPNPSMHNDGETGTIEFRNMEGTLDPALILNWVIVLIRLFDLSRRGNTSDIMAIIEKSRGAYGGLPLLRDLGLEEQAAYFQNKVNHPNNISETFENLFVDAYPHA